MIRKFTPWGKTVMLNSLFAVVPIMGGSGVKVKLLESMAYGIPTITTLHGYQGVEFSERTEPPFLVAEDENDFLRSKYLHLNGK